MGNVATNTIVQMQRLQERGLVLDMEDAKIKRILLDIGYYRLGFYWNPFEIDENHNFKEGTTFSNVVKLYYLDFNLRNILMNYIHRIEVSFRTKVVYYVSNSNKEFPTWFNHPNIMNRDYINSIDLFYSDNFKQANKAIKNHHNKYINDKYAPAWKTLEFFTFGQILKTFKALKNEQVKERISKTYDIRNLKKFTNIMETLVYVRNICSHGGVLFDMQTPKGMSVLPQVTFNNHEHNRHSLDSAIKLLLFILGQISESRRNDMVQELDQLFDNNKENNIVRAIIENKIGYIYKC